MHEDSGRQMKLDQTTVFVCVCVCKSKETKPLILLEGGGNMRAVTRRERGVWG